MIFKNESNRIIYYNVHSNKIISELEALNQASSITHEDYYNFISNGLNTLRRPGTYKYFNGLAAVPPQTLIKVDKANYHILENIPQHKINPNYSLTDLKNEIKFLLQKYEGKKIGVELSGGLDSSLVIEALLEFKIDPVLIGFSSDSFEFRTERIVQNYYKNKVSESILLKYEDNFAFDNLKETPIHPIPVSESHFFQRHKTVALTAKNMGVDILFSGEAGDQILSFPVDVSPNETIPCEYGYWCLAEHWSDQYVFENYGTQYISGLALGNIPSIILSLRNGHKWDPMKLWARNTFKHCLPRELSHFAYTAFHNSWIGTGLTQASDSIAEISEIAYAKYKIEALKPNTMKNSANAYSTFNEEKRKYFLSNLAFVTWYFALINKNL
jgi:hypothetical protein